MSTFEVLTAVFTTFGLIFLAEIGDKSQLVCMTLAARHRHPPVLLGAVVAFILLNSLAVIFGAGLAQWIPEKVLAAAVAVLFGLFGIKSLLTREEEDDPDGEVEEKPGHGIFFTTFTMLFLAEMGDKTQLAVAGLAVTLPPGRGLDRRHPGLDHHLGLGCLAGSNPAAAHPHPPPASDQRSLFPGVGRLRGGAAILMRPFWVEWSNQPSPTRGRE